LIQCFGKHDLFTESNCEKLKNKAHELLVSPDEVNDEFTSASGLACLWDRTFEGEANKPDGMLNAANMHTLKNDNLLRKVEIVFREEVANQQGGGQVAANRRCSLNHLDNPEMNFRTFYDVYLQPFIGCFSCERTRFIISCFNTDNDGKIQWSEWRFWCLFVMREFPEEIANADDVVSAIMRHAILPDSLKRREEAEKMSADTLEGRLAGRGTAQSEQRLRSATKVLAEQRKKEGPCMFATSGMMRRAMKLDTDGDGVLTRAEIVGKMNGEMSNAVFDRIDINGDGQLTREEFDAAAKMMADEIAAHPPLVRVGVAVDTTGDGVADHLAIDTTGNEKADTLVKLPNPDE
jgi:Ca2+-binding EF-hand superfamily protein